MSFFLKATLIVGCFLIQIVFGVYDGIESCGISKYFVESENTNRLINGIAAGKDFFPWIVGIEYENGVNCTGSIISPRHILTAAHCITEVPTDPMKYIRAGDTIIAKMEQLKFDSYVVHKNNGPNLINDIAIITLRENLTFSESISPICLPLHFKDFDHYIYAGFGIIYDGIKNGSQRDDGILEEADHLQHPTKRLNFGKLKTSSCSEGPNESLEKRRDNICTASTNGVTSADSGGPLMQFANGRWFLEGIASGSFEYFLKKPFPHLISRSLFVKTSSFCDWIEENTENEALCQRHNFMKY